MLATNVSVHTILRDFLIQCFFLEDISPGAIVFCIIMYESCVFCHFSWYLYQRRKNMEIIQILIILYSHK